MKIRMIQVFQVDLPLKEASYKWSGGKSVQVFDSTVVKVVSDCGMEGWGEVCPLGPAYLAAYAEGAREGIQKIAPDLLGCDPCSLQNIVERMDATLKGHPYAKSAIDMACWDLLGKKAGLPVCDLMGGRFGDSVNLYRAISQLPPDEMAENVQSYREQGYRRFQLKVGGDPDTDIHRIRAARGILKPEDRLIADANTGWLKHQAMRVAAAIQDLDVYFEQPCLEYDDCLSVRRHTNLPFVLDEVIDSVPALLKGYADQAMDVVNIKISKFGGLTKAKLARDLCVQMGLGLTLEDSWGGDIVTAAISHLAHSTPVQNRFTSTDFNSYVDRPFAKGAPKRENGTFRASQAEGLGIKVDVQQIGRPIATIE